MSPKREESAMGFKDKRKALQTLSLLEQRNIGERIRIIKTFITRAKRVLGITKNEEKLANIREALEVFEEWIENYNREKDLEYLPIEIVRACRILAKKYGVLQEDFFLAYEKENGVAENVKQAKAPGGKRTWQVERRRRLKNIISKITEKDSEWFETEAGKFHGFPSKEHVRCIMLAYSPHSSKLEKLAEQLQEKFGADKEDDTEAYKDSKGSKNKDDEEESFEKIRSRLAYAEKSERKREFKFGFKDKQTALKSIESMNGRDLFYQCNVIKALLMRAKKTVSLAIDAEKIKSINEAIAIFQNWIEDYNENDRCKQNFSYLSIDIVRAFEPLADKYNIKDTRFLKAYESVGGDYRKLRTIEIAGTKVTWDVERNKNLRVLMDRMKEKNISYFQTTENGLLPTEEHARCIMWAFSPQSHKLKKLI